jgi:hypothetical protein
MLLPEYSNIQDEFLKCVKDCLDTRDRFGLVNLINIFRAIRLEDRTRTPLRHGTSPKIE